MPAQGIFMDEQSHFSVPEGIEGRRSTSGGRPNVHGLPSYRVAIAASSVVGPRGPLQSGDEITRYHERDALRLRSVPGNK